MSTEIVAAALTFVAVAGIAGFLLTLPTGPRAVERRLSRLHEPEVAADVMEGSGLLRKGTSRIPFIRSFLLRSAFSERWRLDLEQAGVRLKVSEYLLVRLLFAVVIGLLLMLLLGGSLLGLLITLLLAFVAFMVPAFHVQFRKGRRRDAINRQIVEALELISNSLRSGFAFVQSVEMAVKQLKPPIRDEFEAFLNDTSLGARTEDALRAMAERTGSVDIELMVTTILVQRTSGGNLSEVLDNVAATVRERERLHGDIRTLTAQQRLTGLILSIYPILLGAFFFAMSPGMMSVLWEEDLGRVFLAVAAFLQTMGILSIRPILKLEV